MKSLCLIMSLILFSSCKTQVNFEVKRTDTRLPLSIATTKTWEETGAMCVVDNGDLFCWGASGHAIDENLTTIEITPTKVPKLSGGVRKAALYNTLRSCVIGSDSSLKCAGQNLNPDQVIFPSGVTKVDTGPSNACAIVNSALKCWGNNSNGLLGDGTLVDSATPVDVVGMSSGVTDVSVGLHTVCAIKGGAAFCWGLNSAGSIGDGTTNASSVPVAIPSLSSGVTDISTNYGHYGEMGDSSFAIKDGGLYVWGQNDWGQLGDSTSVDKLTPTLLTPFSTGVSQVDAGGVETCFLHSGDVYCFGLNLEGQMGLTADAHRYAPQKISGISGEVLQVAAGSKRGCASTKDKVYCWGMNSDNVIDSSTMDHQRVPKVVYTRK